ncbi:hypothetical protein [Proteiniborus sp. MB09-C3]|uniref:hypothetical protein n=1 Tax=Proteiniborus sp. MB09-C3 TaxID=3050072 RepID=UPI002555B981|nr:hypothetical protein [Proteiniborus sp. MB09-C3]WIV13186.1 hypothetical protein QO263_05615 [Proteiniborus sp. MB09-C3]
MIIRITEPNGRKGIVVVKDDGRVYKVLADVIRVEYYREKAEKVLFAVDIQDLTRRKGCSISDNTYNVGDDRRLQAKVTYDFIVGDVELTDKVEVKTDLTEEHDGELARYIKAIGIKRTIEDMIEDYFEHYSYSLKEIRCNKCNSNLGYVEGDYSIICDSCGLLNRR